MAMGNIDGQGPVARFNAPMYVELDRYSTTLFVSDHVIYKCKRESAEYSIGWGGECMFYVRLLDVDLRNAVVSDGVW